MESSRRSCARGVLPRCFSIPLTGVLLTFALVSTGTPAGQPGRSGDAGPSANAPEHESGEGHHSPLSSLWKWANFILLFGGLGYVARRPLRAFLEARADRIRQGMADGQRARREAEEKLAAIESRLAHIGQEIDDLKQRASREGEEERRRVIDSSREEADRIVAVAQREIEVLRRSVRLELKAHVAELAVDLAEKQLRRDLGSGENERIIARFVRSLEEKRH